MCSRGPGQRPRAPQLLRRRLGAVRLGLGVHLDFNENGLRPLHGELPRPLPRANLRIGVGRATPPDGRNTSTGEQWQACPQAPVREARAAPRPGRSASSPRPSAIFRRRAPGRAYRPLLPSRMCSGPRPASDAAGVPSHTQSCDSRRDHWRRTASFQLSKFACLPGGAKGALGFDGNLHTAATSRQWVANAKSRGCFPGASVPLSCGHSRRNRCRLGTVCELLLQ